MSLAPNDPEVIIFERSPFGNLDAIVQQDGRTLYLYLVGGDGYPPKACWLGNLSKGPLEINVEDMEKGIPPALPRIHCDHPDGRSLPSQDELEFVWLEEANGVAVMESGSILGVIPPWSGVDDFSGYARDCISETEVAWPLPKTDSMQRRIENASTFWNSFSNSNPFGDLQTSLLDAFGQRLGTRENYWAIDGGQFPNRGLAQWKQGDKTTFCTIGMSLFPQPNIEMYAENPSLHRRIELAIEVNSNLVSEPVVDQIGRFISSLAQMPWRNFTWFGDRHTCELNLESFPGAPFAVLLADPREPVLSYRDDPIQTLWLIPINESEMNLLRAQDDSLLQSNDFQSRLPF